jgi:hypothetical protein
MRQGQPLAQSFSIQSEDVDLAGGRFITSVDLYFAAKHESLPISIEIRNMINGYPGRKILPFSIIMMHSKDVNVDLTAATATTFTFSSPVYVQENTEYALVVKTHLPDYKIWITNLGDQEIGGSRNISTQPHAGVLFKSSNNSTWAESPTEDLKFTIKAAKFTTGTDGIVTLQNNAPLGKQLPSNPLTFTNGNTELKVNTFLPHGMYSTNNNVSITGAKSGASTTLNGAITATATTLTLTSGTNFDDTSGKYSITAASEYFIKIDNEVMKYTTISGNSVSVITRGQDGTTAATHADGATVELYQIHKVPLTEVNKTHTSISNIGMESYTVTLSTTPVISGTGSAENGGGIVAVTENNMMDAGKSLIGKLEFPNAKLSAKIQSTTATSRSGSQTSFIKSSLSNAVGYDLNENIKFETPQMIASEINETNEMSGVKSFEMPITLSSSNSNLSPVIDLTRCSFVAVQNMLDNIDSSSDVFPTTDFVASTEPEGDNNAAIYLTKKVTLENSATAIKVLLSAHRPSTSEIKLMFKILRTDDATDFDDLGYTFFNTTGVDDNDTPASADVDDFQEHIYTAGVTDDGIGDPLDEFISFQIKIVMQGTNSAEPPRIKELRAIALVT